MDNIEKNEPIFKEKNIENALKILIESELISVQTYSDIMEIIKKDKIVGIKILDLEDITPLLLRFESGIETCSARRLTSYREMLVMGINPKHSNLWDLIDFRIKPNGFCFNEN